MRRVPPLLSLAVASVVTASGCKALVVATTAVTADGTWTRTVRFRMPNGHKLSDLTDVFALPRGASWQTRKEWEPAEVRYVARRVLCRGETLRQDVVLGDFASSPAKQLLVNEVTVREDEPGKLEYREVLHWQGRRPGGLVTPERKLLVALQSALPRGLATEADTRDVAQVVLRELWRLWFGPGLPIYSNDHDDLAARRLKRLLGAAVDKALRERFGERMSRTERLAAARQWVAVILKASQERGEGNQSAGPLGLTDVSLHPLLFSLWLPGKVMATNGEVDEVSGEVYWGLYPEAAAFEDVALTATCDLPPMKEATTINKQR